MGNDYVAYEWECPICGKSRWGLLAQNRAAVREQAKNVLLGHVRRSSGEGHGNEHAYPPSFNPDEAPDHIEIGGVFEDLLYE